MCKIAILENYSLFCSGIRPVLENHEEIEIVAESKQLIEILPKLKVTKPDVLIFDVIHSEQDGLTVARKIKQKNSRLPILLIINKDYTEHFEDYIALGVNGFVCNSADTEELTKAVQSIYDGEDYFPPKIWILLKDYLRTKRKDIIPEKEHKSVLSNREVAILQLFCKGLTYKEIGAKLNISPRTVETHKKNISTKINVRSTAEMVEYAFQNDLS